jgi:hypothetical protein
MISARCKRAATLHNYWFRTLRGLIDSSLLPSGMKFTTDRLLADPDVAARKLVEIANAVEAVQDGRSLPIERQVADAVPLA